MPNLSEKFSGCFSELIRASASEKIVILSGSASEVRGEWYAGLGGECRLWLAENHRLCGECSCGIHNCHHLWGLLKAAEQAGDLLQALKRNVKAEILAPEAVNISQTPASEKRRKNYSREDTISPTQASQRHALSAYAPPTTADNSELQYIPLAEMATRGRHSSFQPKTKEEQLARDQMKRLVTLANQLVVEENPNRQLLVIFRLSDLSAPEQQPDQHILPLELWWRDETTDGARCVPAKIEQIHSVPTSESQLLLTAILRLATPGSRANGLLIPAQKQKNLQKILTGQSCLRLLSSTMEHLEMAPTTANARLQLQVENRNNAIYHLSAKLVSGKHHLSPEQLRLVTISGWIIADNFISPLADNSPEYRKYLQHWQNGENLGGPFPTVQDVKYKLARLAVHPGIFLQEDAPTVFHPDALDVAPTGVLHIAAAEYKVAGHEQLDVSLDYQYGAWARCQANSEELFLGSFGGKLLERNLLAERELCQALSRLGFLPKPANQRRHWQLRPALLETAVDYLVNAGWFITAQGKNYVRPTEKPVRIQKSGTDWLDLEAPLEFAGQEIPFPELLKALKNGQKNVVLDDGTIGILPREWLERYTALTEFGQEKDGHLLFRVQQGLLLENLLEQRLDKIDAELTRTLDALRRFTTPTPRQEPPGFQTSLRPYQQEGFGWLYAMGQAGLGVCLADDMGLGKTVQVLALLRQRQLDGARHPSLVVMPKSLLGNWQAEAKRFAPTLRTACYFGAERNIQQLADQHIDVIFTTYGLLRLDIDKLAGCHFDYCILDESQSIKNVESSTAQAARSLNADYRLAMTGTPIENSLAELFSQLEFLNPGLCGREQGVLKLTDCLAHWQEHRLNAIRKSLRPFLLRRKKEDVAKDLPPKTEQPLFCEMDESQRAYYTELQDYYRQELLEKQAKDPNVPDSFGMLSALLRLRQAACAAQLVNPQLATCPSAKLELLLLKLTELIETGHRILVFSQFTSFLQMLGNRLKERQWQYLYLDGQTNDRAELVRQFQENPKISLFLISLKAGGVGLNLTGADYVFILDPWWNPAAEAQAIDRAYRIGQQRPVFAYRLITKGTVEEKVMAMQDAKRKLAADILSGAPSAGTQLSLADVQYLIS